MEGNKLSIFRAYDIRGVYPDELDEELYYNVGKAFVKFLDAKKVVVARDMRVSSPKLHKSLINGVTSMGADVVDIGLSSTPNFYHTVAAGGYDGGLIVSASHNPKEYNGIKIVREEAKAIGLVNGLLEIKKLSKQDLEETTPGKVTIKKDALKKRVNYALNFYNFNLKELKVVADPANAMGSPDLEELFKHIPCKLVKMNFELDGTFPAHEADPFKDKNVKDLKKKVVQEKADLGIAMDGDADRIFFIDEKGKMVEPAIVRGMMAREVLKHNPGSKICYDIRPGMITRDMIEDNGGIPVVTKVGHTLIKKKAREEGAVFAGESSGHFFFQTDYGFYETPLIVALVMMQEITKNGPLSEIVKPLKKYHHSGEINFKVGDKKATLRKLEKEFKDAPEIKKLDGLSVYYDDWWFNVRPSNTEDKIRLNLEATTKARMEKMRDYVKSVIKEAPYYF